MRLEKIHYHAYNRGKLTTWEITRFKGIPFYRSSGQNSHYPGTWFVFLGLVEVQSPFKMYPQGSFIKPISCEDMEPRYRSLIDALFQDIWLVQRFGSLPCLLISSLFGGGLWKEKAGKKLLRQCHIDYPDFYLDTSNIEFSPQVRDFYENDSAAINEWLRRKPYDQQDLVDRLLVSVDDLFQILKKKPQQQSNHCIIIESERVIEPVQNTRQGQYCRIL